MFSGLVKSLSAAVIAVSFAGAANAGVVFSVSSTSVANCGSAQHGLWTNGENFSGGSCGNYYDIQNGMTFTLNNDDADSSNWTGSLNGFAVNPQGVLAEIDLALSGFAEVGNYKKEGGIAYDDGNDTPDIDFFEEISGSISFFAGTPGEFTYTVNAGDPVPMGLNFQWGQGANAKSPSEYGGSVWLNMLDENGQAVGGHFDLNLTFEVLETTNEEIPEPGMLAILGLGLVTLGVARRKRRVA